MVISGHKWSLEVKRRSEMYSLAMYVLPGQIAFIWYSYSYSYDIFKFEVISGFIPEVDPDPIKWYLQVISLLLDEDYVKKSPCLNLGD